MENERRQHRQHPPQWANQNNQHRSQLIRSPLRFTKGEFRESDYESDYECRIQPIWRPYDSESEGPVYKPVRPSFKSPSKQMEPPSLQRYQSPMRTVTTPVQLKQIIEPEFDLKPGSPPQMGFAPSPDMHRSVSFVESEQNESIQRTTHFLSSNGGTAFTDSQVHGNTLQERNAEAKRLQRVDEMRKRFEQKSLVPNDSRTESVQTHSYVSSQSKVSTQGITAELA